MEVSLHERPDPQQLLARGPGGRLYNVDHVLREEGVRDKATLKWISNEYELGDFGMGGVHITRGGYITNGKVFAESLMVERGISWITRAHVSKIEPGKIHYETLAGEFGELEYDFAMLIPPFAGVGMQAFDKAGQDITSELFAPNGFMKVDGDYTPRPYEAFAVDLQHLRHLVSANNRG